MLTVEAIPAFQDNYIWLLSEQDTPCVVVVDPGDPAPIQAHLDHHQLQLSAILLTHHHSDHVGGVTALCEAAENEVIVYGPENSPFKQITQRVRAGTRIELEHLNTHFDVLEIPGHTLDHIAYHNDKMLFCGDTLFAGGCGRLFEGSAEQMWQSLCLLRALNDDCLVYCGHEYTLDNLQFAITIEPDNEALQTRYQRVVEMREIDQNTLPSTIGTEKETNLFFRADTPALQAFAANTLKSDTVSPAETFALIRKLKDTFGD